MSILSIQSRVSYGHVGNAAAVFCLRRTGHDVWPVDTVAFSNHPGYGSFGGGVRASTEVADIIGGLEALGLLPRCRAVLSGYLGSAATGALVADVVARVKAVNPAAIYCCDPVMGDHDPGLYVPDDLVAVFKSMLVPAADVLIPNHFELEVLVGKRLRSLAAVRAAADDLLAAGPRTVVVTSLATPDVEDDAIGNLVVTTAGAWLVTTPRLPLSAKGSGDALAALFLGRYLQCRDAVTALADAVASVFAVIAATSVAGGRELHLVAAQDDMIAPTKRFPARRLR